MALTKQQKDIITEKFAAAFAEPVQLGNALKTDNAELYQSIVNDIIQGDDFPKEANHENVNHVLEISSKIESSAWAEQFIEELNIEDTASFDRYSTDMNDYYSFIFGTMDSTNTTAVINDDPIVWKENNPTAEYLGQVMEKEFDKQYISELIPELDPNFEELMEEAIYDDAFPEGTSYTDLEYEINDIGLKGGDYRQTAELYLNAAKENGNVTNYINDEFFVQLVSDGNVGYTIKITTDPEEL